jgi:hypothetical protein
MTDENNGTNSESESATSAAAVSKAEPKDPIPSKPATEADLDKVEKRLSGFWNFHAWKTPWLHPIALPSFTRVAAHQGLQQFIPVVLRAIA